MADSNIAHKPGSGFHEGPSGFESPVTKSYRLPGVGLTLADRSSASKRIVRADGDTVAANQLGVGFGASRASGQALICGQRPGEWAVIGPKADVDSVLNALDTAGHVSVIDHTHSRAMFRLTGARATSLLAKISGLDWSDDMTPDGAVVSASVAKTTCDLIRNDVGGEPSYLLLCDRSFGQYLFDAVLDAGSEFDIGVPA